MSLLIVQPVLTSYRIPFFEALASQGDVVVCAAVSDPEFGEEILKKCKFIPVSWYVFFGLKLMPVSVFFSCLVRAKIIVHVADFKFISLWCFLAAGLLSKKKIFIHGQGGYKKSGFFHRYAYFFAVLLSDGYVCYTDYSAQKLRTILPCFLHGKVNIVDNTLYIKPVDGVSLASSTDIFYIGRLREGCGVELLLKAAMLADVVVRLVGGGDEAYIRHLRKSYSCGKFFGSVFDRNEQLVISKGCLAGVYGGDAGLSVVHYMAFGLPVIVHGTIDKHMGPEPSYIENGVNGLTFSRDNVMSLAEKISLLKNDLTLRDKLAAGALRTFKSLESPPMHEKINRIIERT
jgi:glycosyltransferase involved in cell wall biosynthesis